MVCTVQTISIISVAVIGWGLASAVAGDIAPKQVPEITVGDSWVLVRKGQNQVLKYVFRERQFKPYVLQLFTPAGINILRDEVPDHLHHHGLMFGVAVEGINFWEEGPLAGRQVHKDVKSSVTGFVEAINWIDQGQKHVLLNEERQIDVDVSNDLTTLVFWKSKFTLASDRTTAKLSGTDYNGLGMRFVTSMDRAGTFMRGRTRVGQTSRADKQTSWCAYTAEVNSKPVTVAMFNHPSNVRPTTWFTMSNPFAYLSATMSLHESPLVLTRDHPLILRYGVGLWDGRAPSEHIEEAYQRWLLKWPTIGQ